MTKRVLVAYGTRPEAIKMAPLIEALNSTVGVETSVAVTGQHREMLDQVNRLFGIVPDEDMDIMRQGATLAEISGRVLERSTQALHRLRPDAVVVQGDTTSAFVIGLAAFYEGIPVIHLEAGLRTGDMQAPFPEEGNRRLLSTLASLHLAPTPTSRANLERENVPTDSIVVTGNTVIDALRTSLSQPPDYADPRIADLMSSGRHVLLVTIHRREAWGERMAEAMSAVKFIAESYPDLGVVLPMHRNSIVRETIEPALAGLSKVLLVEPLDYHSFTHVMAGSHVVLTDSGGVQEEAPSLGKPVLVMRDTTERPEAVSAGTVRLVGTDRNRIVRHVSRLLDDENEYRRFAQAVNPYGDGHASRRGAAAIAHFLGLGERVDEFVPGDVQSTDDER